VEVWQTSSLRPLRLGDEKKQEKEERRKKQDKNTMSASAMQGGHKKCKIKYNSIHR